MSAEGELPDALRLSVGERHEVAMPGLGTAGYRWDEELTGDAGAVAVEWQRGMSAEEARGRPVGSSAPERIALTATAPGHVTVRLSQRRPWESGPPRAEHTIEIDVTPP
ncbi:protease inhibitor I42 family protein [Microlunatus ginsengisoli]|uniref:Proteinase inhibitor I42 chagasin domain-containing protein n=1 Tax=Microlunatus ginsengisoli TaxID=363863 RepID=A0ABP7AJP0_9ACTN